MTIQTTSPVAKNGVDLEALLWARQALTDEPAAAQFIWRARCEWLEGTHSRSTVTGFYGLCDEHVRKAPHRIEADHPEQFAAPDLGATPVEIMLSALASCLTAGVATVAENRNVTLRSVAATVEGDMNLQGILGIDPGVRNGFSAIRVSFEIDADATREEIAGIVAQSQKRSALFDIITNPTAVTVSVD